MLHRYKSLSCGQEGFIGGKHISRYWASWTGDADQLQPPAQAWRTKKPAWAPHSAAPRPPCGSSLWDAIAGRAIVGERHVLAVGFTRRVSECFGDLATCAFATSKMNKSCLPISTSSAAAQSRFRGTIRDAPSGRAPRAGYDGRGLVRSVSCNHSTLIECHDTRPPASECALNVNSPPNWHPVISSVRPRPRSPRRQPSLLLRDRRDAAAVCIGACDAVPRAVARQPALGLGDSVSG
jgi:hypothetical protein